MKEKIRGYEIAFLDPPSKLKQPQINLNYLVSVSVVVITIKNASISSPGIMALFACKISIKAQAFSFGSSQSTSILNHIKAEETQKCPNANL
jgi:hypothetical protein